MGPGGSAWHVGHGLEGIFIDNNQPYATTDS